MHSNRGGSKINSEYWGGQNDAEADIAAAVFRAMVAAISGAAEFGGAMASISVSLVGEPVLGISSTGV
jgi:hypothetical protein